jgi:hypothetical protein
VRHQRTLELFGRRVLDLVGDAAADRLGGLRREGAEEPPVVVAEAPLGVVTEHQRADRLVVLHQRDGHQAPHPERGLVLGDLRVRRGDVRRAAEEDVSPVADRVHDRQVGVGVDAAPAWAGLGEPFRVGGDEAELPATSFGERDRGPDEPG